MVAGHWCWLIGPKLFWPKPYHPTCVSSKLCKFILVVSILILYKPSWFLLLNPQLNRCFTYRRPFLKPFLQMKKMGPTLCFFFFWQKNIACFRILMISWAKSFTSLEAEINQDIKNGGFLFSRYLDGIFPCKKSCIIEEKFFKQM